MQLKPKDLSGTPPTHGLLAQPSALYISLCSSALAQNLNHVCCFQLRSLPPETSACGALTVQRTRAMQSWCSPYEFPISRGLESCMAWWSILKRISLFCLVLWLFILGGLDQFSYSTIVKNRSLMQLLFWLYHRDMNLHLGICFLKMYTDKYTGTTDKNSSRSSAPVIVSYFNGPVF